MSPYALMRDPAENKDLLPGTAFFGDQPNAGEGLSQAQRYIKFVRDSVRLLSFTGEQQEEQGPFGCSWARPRMWEQYADVHRGVCLLFDRDRLVKSLTDQFGAQPGPYYFGDVRYTPQGIAGSATDHIIDERIFDDVTRPLAVMAYIDRNRDDFFFLKSDDFASEREFRALLMHPDPSSELRPAGDQFVYVSCESALIGVMVGERFPDWQMPGARALCEAFGLTPRRIVWEKGRPWALRLRSND